MALSRLSPDFYKPPPKVQPKATPPKPPPAPRSSRPGQRTVTSTRTQSNTKAVSPSKVAVTRQVYAPAQVPQQFTRSTSPSLEKMRAEATQRAAQQKAAAQAKFEADRIKAAAQAKALNDKRIAEEAANRAKQQVLAQQRQAALNAAQRAKAGAGGNLLIQAPIQAAQAFLQSPLGTKAMESVGQFLQNPQAIRQTLSQVGRTAANVLAPGIAPLAMAVGDITAKTLKPTQGLANIENIIRSPATQVAINTLMPGIGPLASLGLQRAAPTIGRISQQALQQLDQTRQGIQQQLGQAGQALVQQAQRQQQLFQPSVTPTPGLLPSSAIAPVGRAIRPTPTSPIQQRIPTAPIGGEAIEPGVQGTAGLPGGENQYTNFNIPYEALGFADRMSGVTAARQYYEQTGQWPWEGPGDPNENLADWLRQFGLGTQQTPGLPVEEAYAPPPEEYALPPLETYAGGEGGYGGGGYGGYGGYGGGYGGYGGGYSPRPQTPPSWYYATQQLGV